MAKRRSYRRAWHRTADSVFHESWTVHEVGMVTLLSAAMHERWRTEGLSAEEASTICLNRAAVCRISGKSQFKVGAKLLQSLSKVVSTSIETTPDFVRVEWPKWPEFQGLDPNVTAEGSNTAPAPAPSPAHAQKKQAKKDSASTKRKVPTPIPEVIPDEWKRGRVEDLCAEAGIEPDFAWACLRDWAEGAGKTYVSWPAVMKRALRERWNCISFPKGAQNNAAERTKSAARNLITRGRARGGDGENVEARSSGGNVYRLGAGSD